MGLGEKVEKIWNKAKLGLAKGLVYSAASLCGLNCCLDDNGGNGDEPPGIVTQAQTNEQGEADVEDSDGIPFKVIVKDEKTLVPLFDKTVYVVHHSEEVYTMDPLKDYIADFKILSEPIDLEVLLSKLSDRINDGLSEYKTSFHPGEINWTLGTEKIASNVPLSGLAEFYRTHEDTSKSMALVLEVASNYSAIACFAKWAHELRQDIIESACPVAQLVGLNPDQILYDIYLEKTSGLLYHERVDSGPDGVRIHNFDSYCPSIAAGPNDNLHVVWCDSSGSDCLILYSKFDGNNWSTPSTVDNVGISLVEPRIAVDSGNRPHVVWWKGGFGEVYHSMFEGVSWSTPQNLSQNSSNSNFPRIAIDSNDIVNVIWHDNYPNDFFDDDWEVFFRKSNDGISWSSVEDLSDGDYDSIYSSITVDSNDNVHVAWYDDVLDELLYKKYDGAGWSPREIVDSGSMGEGTSIAVDYFGTVHLVWPNGSYPYDIYYSNKNGGNWSPKERIFDNDYDAIFPKIIIDSSNRSHVMWYQKDLLHSYNDSTWAVPQVINSDGLTPSVVVDSTDDLHVVWHDYNGAGIYYRKIPAGK